jgi:hypothetical protein
MPTILYVLLAVFLPIAWGLFSAWSFEFWRKRRGIKTLNVHRNSPDSQPRRSGQGVTSEPPQTSSSHKGAGSA